VSTTCKGDPQRRDLRLYADALMTSLVAGGVGGTFLSSQYNEMLWHFIGLATTLSFLAVEQPSQAAAPAAAPVAVKPQPFAAALRATSPKQWSPSSSR